MASLSFPTTIFENFEIHLPCSVTGTVSLSPRHNASAVLMPAANIHGLVDQRSSVDSSVQISSFEKNGHKIWRIHLSSSQELHEAGTRDLQGPTPISSQHQATSDSQYYHPIPDSYSISSNESVMDQLSWNTIHEMLSIAPTQSSFSLDNNQQSPGEPISLSAQLSASGSSDHSSSPLQYGEPVQEYQLSPSSPSVQSSPETYTSEDEDSHSPAQRTLFRCTAPNSAIPTSNARILSTEIRVMELPQTHTDALRQTAGSNSRGVTIA
ncbi:hypothetical protein M413DRAFT_32420 [Hebeloma cylindrosporum]|uniref:Uncharacterized protein n=1 Tax=Hebeloma cylindrosporum TaxID=76867 RepID=A0A0C2XCA6_HEBCY|nr:hypothetical protein M413DRAFT_32420 [Hebeloma cylindrosporum h7]